MDEVEPWVNIGRPIRLADVINEMNGATTSTNSMASLAMSSSS
jgi:hypothetical protein